jgi:hypothetical protein
MAVPAETRTARIHLPDGRFRYCRNISLDTNIGAWKETTRSDYGLVRGRLEAGDYVFDNGCTFRDTPNVELDFVGAVAQQPTQPQQGREIVVHLFPICMISLLPALKCSRATSTTAAATYSVCGVLYSLQNAIGGGERFADNIVRAPRISKFC